VNENLLHRQFLSARSVPLRPIRNRSLLGSMLHCIENFTGEIAAAVDRRRRVNLLLLVAVPVPVILVLPRLAILRSSLRDADHAVVLHWLGSLRYLLVSLIPVIFGHPLGGATGSVDNVQF